MTNKEKEGFEDLKEGEEKSEEKGSGKSINEQKEVLQAMQRDISNSSQKITRIELGIERTNFVNYWYVAGGLVIAVALALIGISFSLISTDSSAILGCILVFSGIFILVAGELIGEGAYHAGTDLKKYPFELSRKELCSTNKFLYYGIILCVMVFCVSGLIVLLTYFV